MGDRLATIDMSRKERGLLCPPFLREVLCPSSRLATTDIGRKLGAMPLLGGGSWVPI